MTLEHIQALRDLDHGQLADLAKQRGILFTEMNANNVGVREWSPDRLRLRIIDSIVEEELAGKVTAMRVPEEFVDAALETWREKLFSPRPDEMRKALEAVLPMVRDRFEAQVDILEAAARNSRDEIDMPLKQLQAEMIRSAVTAVFPEDES